MRLLLSALVVCLPLCAQTLKVTGGVTDYQVVQRDKDAATITVTGTAAGADGKTIDAALVSTLKTGGGQPLREIRKPRVATIKGGQWTATLERVPVGGPYDITFQVTGTKEGATVKQVLVGDLWVLAGQSNMEGVGDLVDTQPPDERVNMFDMRDEWRQAKDPLHSLPDSNDRVHWRRPPGGGEPARLEGEARDKWISERKKGAGVGLPFAVEMVRRTGVPVGLIPCAHGGTSMDQWSPALKDQGGDSLYGATLRRVKLVGGRVTGVLWYQGESDANPKAMPVFQEKFEKLVAAFRADFSKPDLAFYYVQIGRHVSFSNLAEWNQVQDLQRKAEANLGRAGMVPAVDNALDDGIHVSTPDLKRLGRRMAGLACHDLFPEKASCASLKKGPRPVAAKLEQGIIRLTFSDVNGKLTSDGRIGGFTIQDPAGVTLPAVYKAQVDPKDGSTVLISVQGRIPDGAMLWYGAGKDPYCNLKDAADMGVPVFAIPVQQ